MLKYFYILLNFYKLEETEMFEELRKKTFRKSLIATVIVLIIGIALIGWKIADLFLDRKSVV